MGQLLAEKFLQTKYKKQAKNFLQKQKLKEKLKRIDEAKTNLKIKIANIKSNHLEAIKRKNELIMKLNELRQAELMIEIELKKLD